MKYYSFFFVFKGAHEIASLSSEKEYPLQKKNYQTCRQAGYWDMYGSSSHFGEGFIGNCL